MGFVDMNFVRIRDGNVATLYKLYVNLEERQMLHSGEVLTSRLPEELPLSQLRHS